MDNYGSLNPWIVIAAIIIKIILEWTVVSSSMFKTAKEKSFNCF